MADPRNDQTLIILQLHVAMQMFHNKLVDLMRMQRVPRSAVFESARRMARWHYQWIVTHEFLPAIVGTTMTDSVYKEASQGADHQPQVLQADQPRGALLHPGRVRGGRVPLRPQHHPTPLHRPGCLRHRRHHILGSVSGVPLFEDATPNDNNLNGHRDRCRASAEAPVEQVLQRDGSEPTARPVRQFDASLADPLFKLPTTALPDANALGLLSQRNLLRGRKMGLPSGQQVARLMGVTPLTNAQLSWNHRIHVQHPHRRQQGGGQGRRRGEYDEENQSLKTDFADPGWNGEAPLWFYILKEAELVAQGPHARARSAGGSWRRSSSVCCRRTPTPTCTCSPTGSPRLPSRRERQIHHGRSPQVRAGLVLTNGGDEPSNSDRNDLREN